MKPRFEEHDNQLFRMLEEHEIVPLKENDENVLVRFITHGVIGEYVMKHWLDCNQENVPIYIDDVDSDGDVTVWIDENRNEHHCCPFPMFEIIGTLVKEGSAEWALWAMMDGNKVINSNSTMPFTLTDDRIVRIDDSVSWDVGHWLRIFDDTTGWQLYEEPKPKYKAGDFVEIRNWDSGTTHLAQIDSIDHEIHIGTHRFDISGKSVMERVPQLSIIHKLKPSEVVVEIGCLSGTVTHAISDDCFLLAKVNDPQHRACCIDMSMLDKETRELVEGLLKAQKEEEK